jgi:hypothetical protein
MNEALAPAGLFLAVLEYLKPDPQNCFARLRPLYQVDDLRWQPVRENDARFRDEGLVFWWRPPTPAKQGTLWLVTLDLDPVYGRDQQRCRDRCRVTEARSPFQAVALHGVHEQQAFRRSLASGRLSFEGILRGRALMEVPGQAGRWLALREGLVPSFDGNLSSVIVNGLEGVLPVYTIDPDAFVQISIGAHRYSLLTELGTSDGYQCALSDTQLVEHMRKQVSAHGRQDALEAIGVTKKLLREYIDLIETVGLSGDEASKEETRLDAAKTLIEGLEAESALVEELLPVLMQHPSVAEPLAERIDAEMKAAQERWERETASERQQAHEELADLQCKIEVANSELKTLRSSIDSVLRDILEAPVEALVRHGLSDALHRSLPSLTARPSAIEPTKSCPPPSISSFSGDSGIETITDVDRLKAAVTNWALDTGVDFYMLHVALAAVLAHRVTLLSGTSAERLAHALASTLAGDNAVRVSIGTAVFSLADVMQTAIVAVGSTRLDGSSTLGRFLAQQSSSDKTTVVILSGCNRAPPEIVIADLLSILGGAPTTLAWSQADGSITDIKLHSRVRFIGTLHDGSATYSVPSLIARQVAVVPADHREVDIDPPQTHSPEPTHLDGAVFDGLSALSEDEDVTELAKWLRTSGSTLPISTLCRILSVYLNFLSNPMRAPAEAIAALMLGRFPESPLTDLPGRHADAMRDHLGKRMSVPAWQATWRHFATGDAR